MIITDPGAWTYGGAPPKYATARNPAHASDGPRIARLASALGKPGMPWQRYVWDVATERDSFGRLVYEIVMVTVPRQSGKTTMYGPVQLDRAIMNPGIKTFYTAQTGKDARSRFNDLVQLMQQSPMEKLAKYRYSAGDEGIIWPNRSANKIFAPVMAALHGETPPLVGLDEIWEWPEELGDAILEGAIFPAQLTLAGRRQVWLISTAGTALSTFMRKWLEKGRAGTDRRMAIFDWSLADGDDPLDVEAIRRFHPAVGFTVTAEELLEQVEEKRVGLATWYRAYCNLWTEAADPVMPAEDWAALVAAQLVPSRRSIALTYDVAPDSTSADVWATWWDSDGRPNMHLVHHAPGTAWLAPLVRQLAKEWRPRLIGADDGGPTRRITSDLRTGDDEQKIPPVDVVTTGGRDFSTACEAFLAYAQEERSLIHDGSKVAARAMAGLVLKRRGDLTSFARAGSATSPASLIASAVGLWLLQHQGQERSGDVFDLSSVFERSAA